MESPDRRLLLRTTEIFSALDPDKLQGQTSPIYEQLLEPKPTVASEEDWKLLLLHCDALLKAGGLQAPPTALEAVAAQLIRVSNNCFSAGFDAGLNASAKLRAGTARAAKRRKADERRRILQRAIVAVCTQQRLDLAASEKFALSIHADVIQAAAQFGLRDAKSGTSTRSLQRHIAALLNHERMP